MSEGLFADSKELDIEFLNDTYADDAETAVMVFQQYLDELPVNLKLLSESYHNRDIERFRHLVHKQKPGFSYVGLTGFTQHFLQLQLKCLALEDLDVYRSEIEGVLGKIKASTPAVEQMLKRLQQYL